MPDRNYPPSHSAEVRNPVLASAFGRPVSMRVRVGPLRALPPMTFWKQSWIPFFFLATHNVVGALVHENVERDTLILLPERRTKMILVCRAYPHLSEIRR